MTVSDTQKRDFADRGWFHVGRVFDDAELEEIGAEYDRLLAQPMRIGEQGKEPFEYGPLLHTRSDVLCRYATDPRLVRVAVALLGPDVRLYWDQAVSKPPGATSDVPWHQDNGYGPVEPREFTTFTVALDATSEANGCLWLQPGSQRRGVVDHRPTDTIFFSGYDGADAGEAAPQSAGDVMVFSSLTLHRSGPNRSDRPRRSWIIQFCRAETRHGATGRLFDDRLLVAEAGEPLAAPVRQRPLDLGAIAREAREGGWSRETR